MSNVFSFVADITGHKNVNVSASSIPLTNVTGNIPGPLSTYTIISSLPQTSSRSLPSVSCRHFSFPLLSILSLLFSHSFSLTRVFFFVSNHKPSVDPEFYIPFTAPNVNASGAGGGPVFLAPGLNLSMQPATLPPPVNLTALNQEVPSAGEGNSSSSGSGNGSSGGSNPSGSGTSGASRSVQGGGIGLVLVGLGILLLTF